MVSSDSDDSELNDLAYEFAQRIRRGEQPTVLEFAAAHPELAAEILELFPALLTIERFDPLAATAEGDSAAVATALSSIPKQVGEYAILRFIGRGGMGVVYEAVHDALGRHVALKMLAGGASTDARALRRFKCESRAAARLHHSNIVPVFEVGEAAGLHYYAMQLIHGISLDRVLDEVTQIRRQEDDVDHGSPTSALLRSSKLDFHRAAVDHHKLVRQVFQGSSGLMERDHRYFREVARLGEQAADALACAHRDGILHRDIKPSNLLLDVQGTLWVSDFGLARVDGQSDLTADADLVGTIRYMSPERFEGRVDHRSDVYSLGLTLMEMLTLRPAFSGDNRGELINRILSSQPQPELRSIVGLPRDLATIVLKATAKDPLNRYQTAAAMADDLRRYRSGRPIQARRQSSAERLGYWCRRNKTLASLVAAIAILLTGISAASITASIELRRLLDQTQHAQTDVRKQLLESLLFQSRANRRSGDSGRRFQSLETLRQAKRIADDLKLPPSVIDDIRDETIAALCLADVELKRRVSARPRGTASLDFNPSFEDYARIDVAGAIEICRVADNSVRKRIPSPGPQYQAARKDSVVYSPSGVILQQLCVDLAGNLVLRIWDVDVDPPRMLFESQDGVASAAVFAADSRRIAVNMTASAMTEIAQRPTAFHVHLFDTSTGRECIEPLPSDHTTQCAFHPTLDQLAISDRSRVRVMDLSRGIEIASWDRPRISCLGWSPDGKQIIAAVAEDSRVFRWEVRHRQELPPLIRHVDRPVESVSFDHTGHLVITSARFDWRMWNAQTGQLLWESTSPLPIMRFRQDDRMLAGKFEADPWVGLFRVDRGEELHRVSLYAPWRDGSPRASIRSDGRLVAATAREGTILWDVARREQVGFLPGNRVPLLFPTADSLLTHAPLPEGVVRWRLEADADQSGEYRLLAPESLHCLESQGVESPISGAGTWASSSDGHVIATAGVDGRANVYVSDAADGDVGRTLDYRKITLDQQANVVSTSVSPDGKWVATGSSNWRTQDSRSVTVTVWESATGIRVNDLLVGQSGVPVFSPDGQWIAVLSGQYAGGVSLWRVGSWEEGPPISPVASPGGITNVAFDPGSRSMAVQGEYIRLLDTGTGRELAKLIVPEKTSLAPQCYTPDGGHLFAFDVYNGQLFDWDLNAIRQQLAREGLTIRP